MTARSLTYVLITPARNGEADLEETIRCGAAQTILPLRWVIVSDGSTDKTDAIAAEYAARHSWITLVTRRRAQGRDFAGKVAAFNEGFNVVKPLSFDVVGSLDAD